MSTDRAIDPADPNNEIKGTGYEIFIAALSVLSIVNLVLVYVIHDQALDFVLYAMNLLLTLVFLLDFLYRFSTADSKAQYFFRGFGWADLLASLPFEQAKILRVFRLVKVGRLMNDYGTKRIMKSLLSDRASSALYVLLLVAILVLEFGSLGMLNLEADVPGANITSASDALWYIVVTMATVGYGDEYPITNAGRLLGTGIIVVGVGIFGTLTGYLANLFLSPRKKKAVASPPDVFVRIATLREMIAQQQAALDDLEEAVERR